MEKYWARTVSGVDMIPSIRKTQSRQVRGKWVGSYKMSRGIEKLIRRMVVPDVDVRCFASEALDDSYWIPKEVLKAVQKAAAHRMRSFSPQYTLN